MADKRLNDLSTATDGAYIYAEDASGNQIKIAKADLATVVAGILNLDNFLKLKDRTITHIDELVENGIYEQTTNLTGAPENYGVVLVIGKPLYYRVQFFMTPYKKIYFRFKESVWSSWVVLTGANI